MDIVTRAKNICLSPLTEWPIIAAEPATPGGLLTGYAAPLAAIGAVAGFIGGVVIGHTLPFVGHYRVPLVAGLITALVTFGMALVGVFVLSLVINALAPTFGGEKNDLQALKVAVYSYTPAWIAGVLNLSLLLAMLGIFAALYGLYLLYLGLPRLMKSPENKALPYTVVVLICAIVISIVLSAATAMVAGAGVYGRAATTASSSGDVQFDKDSPLGKLQDISKKMEDSARKGEAAAKSGDANAQAAAAVEGLGALFGGGKRVDPISIEQLKPLVPDTLAGLPKTASSAEKTGFASLMVSKAEATYSDGAGKRVTLDISDTGGVSGIMALAGWASVQGEREDDTGSERTQRIDGRLTHEKTSKNGGTNEYAIVIADRFVVSLTGRGVDVAALKTAVSGMDIAKLESMKDAGVTK